MDYIKNELLDEGYYVIDHPTGLRIFVYPKEGFTSTYAVFGTKYGSIDTRFKRNGSAVTLPEGTAHFLEHKLFESEELDAFERYAKTGASANAYTSFDRTCYLFTCSGHFKENFEILLDFVRHPYFTEETVRKEQGIIGQEIDMYKDMPEWEGLFNLLAALYHNHPVKVDIAGTKQSIACISAELLHSCYNTFYNLSNMALAVAGNVTPEEVIEVADRLLKKDEPVQIERLFSEEPEGIVRDYVEEKLSVVTPVFALGFKETHKTPERTVREEVCKGLLMDLIAGQTTTLYAELLEDGLINDTFSSEYFNGSGYAAPIFSGESSDPKKVADRLRARVLEMKKTGVDEAEFEMVRKKRYGQTIRIFSDIDTIANGLVASHFEHDDLFSEFRALRELTKEELNEALLSSFDPALSALSVISPREGA